MNTDADITAKHRSRTIWSRFKSEAPIVISSIALAISLLSLIWSQLLPAEIQVHPNEVAYLLTESDNLMSVHLYLAFTNSGARPGVVQKVAMLIQPTGKSDGYLLEAAFFDSLDERGNYRRESVMGPIPVDGHQTVSRQIRFLSASDRPGDYLPLFVRGEYRATVLVWTSTNTHPTNTASFPFVLSEVDIEKLSEMRSGKPIECVSLHHSQFQRWNARAVNEQEVRELLGGH